MGRASQNITSSGQVGQNLVAVETMNNWAETLKHFSPLVESVETMNAWAEDVETIFPFVDLVETLAVCVESVETEKIKSKRFFRSVEDSFFFNRIGQKLASFSSLSKDSRLESITVEKFCFRPGGRDIHSLNRDCPITSHLI